MLGTLISDGNCHVHSWFHITRQEVDGREMDSWLRHDMEDGSEPSDMSDPEPDSFLQLEPEEISDSLNMFDVAPESSLVQVWGGLFGLPCC